MPYLLSLGAIVGSVAGTITGVIQSERAKAHLKKSVPDWEKADDQQLLSEANAYSPINETRQDSVSYSMQGGALKGAQKGMLTGLVLGLGYQLANSNPLCGR